MRIIFAGTPEFAACALQSLLAAGHEVVLVLTRPDRPGGRGMKLVASPVKQLAAAAGLPILQPSTLKDPIVQKRLSDSQADVMVVAAYGMILPQSVLDIPLWGAVNIHASLLPRWRGAAPIQRALLAGDRQTGITIMRMDAGLDTGPILLQEAFDIEEHDTSQSLHDRLAHLGARMVVQALAAVPGISPQPQPEQGVTYAHKLTKGESRINWSLPANVISRAIRAYFPAYSSLKGIELKLWRGAVHEQEIATGTVAGQVLEVSPGGLTVACGQGALTLMELQRSGGKRLTVADFIRGFAVQPGDRFEPE